MAGVNPADERVSILLSCYLDGVLTPAELDDVVTALESDLRAVAEFRHLKEVRSAVRRMPTLEMPLYLLPGVHVGEELSAFLDGELTTEEVPIVTGHLDGCSECRLELADLDRSRTAIRALPGLESPVFLEAHREKSVHKNRRLRTVVAVATGAAAVALAFTVGPFASSSEPASITIADLDARHAAVALVPSAVRVSTVGTAP
ncbi:MAG: hypothetical protein BMS9Abin20_0595 [Acidimicrobiia bacterium]|nr:MAG: hypothetical protein BMS9Abin20_0595 [Acidimicrobiia bacterium]